VSYTAFELASLKTHLRPFRLHWFPTLRSTNDHAVVLRKRGKLYAPAAVLTGRQTAGRGRGANLWWSSAGTITVTFVWPIDDTLQPQQLPLIVGIAVRRACAELTGDDGIQLKWPNDLLYKGRKVAGLLCERIERADLIGLGLNVCTNLAAMPRGLQHKVTSLSNIAGRPIGVTEALATVAKHLHQILSKPGDRPFARLLQEYDQHHALIGRRVSIAQSEGSVSGVVKGLDDSGRLLVKDGSTIHHVISGQVNW
jgi:BirA family biotin operon repressor/biotin-[acetyl-CoA-carboxylase] ligase